MAPRYLALALVFLSTLSRSVAGGKHAGEELANVILAHLHESLPPAASHAIDGQESRIRTFADRVLETYIYRTDPDKLHAAARAAIDAADSQSATAASLAVAAMTGVLNSLGHGARLLSPIDVAKQEPQHESHLPLPREVGTIRIIPLPTFDIPEALPPDPLYSAPCSRIGTLFDRYHYFELLPDHHLTGLVLDLRGNSGGLVDVPDCVASELLQPRLPLFQIATMTTVQTVTSQRVGGRAPITLPVAVFIDKETDGLALALAAALQDQGRASIIGEQKDMVSGIVMGVAWTPKFQDYFLLPMGDIRRMGGQRLADGVRVDVVVSPRDEDALMDAARTQLAAAAPP